MIKNLNRRRIDLAVQPKLPVLNVTIDRKGCVVPNSMTGPQGLILNAIAEASNFTWQYYFGYQGFRIKKYNESCLINFSFNSLSNGAFDVMANFAWLPFVRTWTPIDKYLDDQFKSIRYAHIRHQQPLVALVPILHTQNVKLSKNFVALFIATVVMGIVVKIFVLLMKFESRTWGSEKIWYIIFGMSVDSHPKSTSERFVMSSLLIISVVYSMTIMDQLLDIQMDLNSEIRLRSWEELASAKLTLMMSMYDHQLFNDTNNSLFQNLAKKAILPKYIPLTTYKQTHKLSSEEDIQKICIDNIVYKSHKNVSCIMDSAKAKKWIELSKLPTGEEKVIVLKEVAVDLWSAILLNYKIKYVARFEQVVQYLTEAGLIERWYNTELVYTREEISIIKKVGKDKKENTASIIMQLLTIACIGYALSFLVLIGELAMLLSRRKIKLSRTLNIHQFKAIKMHPRIGLTS